MKLAVMKAVKNVHVTLGERNGYFVKIFDESNLINGSSSLISSLKYKITKR